MLTREEKKSALRGEPILWNGLTLFPVKVADYELFSAAKISICAIHQTMPVQYVSLRYLEALYAIEADGRAKGMGPGLFARLLLLFTLVFRLPEPTGKSLETMIPLVKRDDPRKLAALMIRQGDNIGEITPQNFDHLRELIAEQNGLILPNERENADFLEDSGPRSGTPALRTDFESLLYSVALVSHTQPEDVLDWTMRKFYRTEEAADRSRGHLIAALAEASGAKYTKGNPYPSWKFDREADDDSLIALDSFAGRLNGTVSTQTK